MVSRAALSPQARAAATPADCRIVPPAAALLVLCLGLAAGCKEPAPFDAGLQIRAVTPDPYHVLVGFPEALDPAAMSDTTNLRVQALTSDTGGRRLFIVRAAVVDTVRGRTLSIETEPVPDGVSLQVTIDRIRLLTGPLLVDHPVTISLVSGISYWKDIAPLFAEHCNQCHSGASPSGAYSTDSYLVLYGVGTSPPGNLIPGDPRCLLVDKCLPSGSMFWKGTLEFLDAETVRGWVASYQARQ